MNVRQVDFTIRNEGSIALLSPLSDDAKAWVEKNIGPDNGYQPWYPSVVIEHRYVLDIVEGIHFGGLTIAIEQ